MFPVLTTATVAWGTDILVSSMHKVPVTVDAPVARTEQSGDFGFHVRSNRFGLAAPFFFAHNTETYASSANENPTHAEPAHTSVVVRVGTRPQANNEICLYDGRPYNAARSYNDCGTLGKVSPCGNYYPNTAGMSGEWVYRNDVLEPRVPFEEIGINGTELVAWAPSFFPPPFRRRDGDDPLPASCTPETRMQINESAGTEIIFAEASEGRYTTHRRQRTENLYLTVAGLQISLCVPYWLAP